MPTTKIIKKAIGQKGRLCGDCEFFDHRRPGGGTNDDAGICRVSGPTVGHVSTFVEAPDEKGGGLSPQIQILTHWPKVDPTWDWCPKFSPVGRSRKK